MPTPPMRTMRRPYKQNLTLVYSRDIFHNFSPEMDMYGDIVDVDAKREAQVRDLGIILSH